jgi:hypothetical protein
MIESSGERMNTFTFENYPDIRDLTRKLSQDMQARLSGHLEAVKAHFRPASVFGSHISAGSKSPGQESPRNAAAAFAQLAANYKQVAASPALNLDPALPDPIDVHFATPILCPFVYQHPITTPAGTKRLTVTDPFRFVVAFPDYPYSELRNLVLNKGSKEKLSGFVLHYLVLNYLVTQNKRLLSLFEDLRFPIRSEGLEELGGLPVTILAAPAGSVRPPDAFLLQITKFAGTDSAEELVNLEAWDQLSDPVADWYRGEAAKFPDLK